MKVGIVPNAYDGYSAVFQDDGEYEQLTIEVKDDLVLPPDLVVQITGELRHSLLGYCWQLREWFGQWKVALLWAAASGVVLATQKLWTYGSKTALLYGWIYVLFFGHGLMSLTRLLAHAGAMRRAGRIRKGLTEKMKVVYERHSYPQIWWGRLPGESEREFADTMSVAGQWYSPYYTEMATRQPRLAMGYLPNRLTLLWQMLFVGSWVPRPRWAMEIGRIN